MFVRGGYVGPGYALRDAGYDGYYWSSVSNGSNFAYSLGFVSGIVYPSYNDLRYVGQSVRCVALGSRIRFVAKTT